MLELRLIQLIYVCDTYCRLPPLAISESVLLSEPRIYVKSGRIYVLIILNLQFSMQIYYIYSRASFLPSNYLNQENFKYLLSILVQTNITAFLGEQWWPTFCVCYRRNYVILQSTGNILRMCLLIPPPPTPAELVNVASITISALVKFAGLW